MPEFPIAAIGNRLDPSVKTILFQDATFDKSTGETITRKLTITASDQYGLPTAPDDEILLGLRQLSRIQNFETPTVPLHLISSSRFSDGTSIQTTTGGLKESINRWMGVTLYYENAWRDKRTGSGLTPVFISWNRSSSIGLVRKALLPRRVVRSSSGTIWCSETFREGNLKILDFHFYRSLEGGITKRLFRFLDKRFYMCKSRSFDLEAFACEKIGLTRPIKMNPSGRPTTDIAQIKRRLLKAIQELESIGYIKNLPALRAFYQRQWGNVGGSF